MSRYALFYRQFIAVSPKERVSKISDELWEMLAEIEEEEPHFSLKLMGLINSCPETAPTIIENPKWLEKLNRCWHWYDIFVALRALNYPGPSCKIFSDYLQDKGEEGAGINHLLSQRYCDAEHTSLRFG